MAKYDKQAQEMVGKVMRKLKKDTLKSGKSKIVVKNPKETVEIGLSKARKKETQVPKV